MGHFSPGEMVRVGGKGKGEGKGRGLWGQSQLLTAYSMHFSESTSSRGGEGCSAPIVGIIGSYAGVPMGAKWPAAVQV